MGQAADAIQIGQQPDFQAGQQGGVAHVRPVARRLLLQIQLAQQRHPRLPLAQLRRPGQQLQPLAPHQSEQGRLRAAVSRFFKGSRLSTSWPIRRWRSARNTPSRSSQSSSSWLPPVGQRPLEQRRIQFGGQVDTLFALALATAQIGHHQPGRFHQSIRSPKLAARPLARR